MIKNNTSINRITKIALLASLASVIGLVDKLISGIIFSMLPGIKIGLTNVIILISIVQYTFKESILVVIIKVIIVSFLFGSITSLIIGGSASLISFLVMSILYKKFKTKLNLISISIIGGFIHINIQLIMIGLIYNIGKEIYLYGFMLITISLLTSIIVGVITNKIRNINIQKMHI